MQGWHHAEAARMATKIAEARGMATNAPGLAAKIAETPGISKRAAERAAEVHDRIFFSRKRGLIQVNMIVSGVTVRVERSGLGLG